MIKDLTEWRAAWEDILKLQYDASEAFADLYKPVEPSSDPEMVHQPVQTPAKYMQKCLGLQKEYSDEKTDLAQEIAMITSKLVRPAEEAKQHTKLLHKTLKHRDNMKLDYERYLSRAEHARKKEARNAKEEAALATHEANLAQAQIQYQTADEHVKQTIPPVSAAVLSLLPFILHNQIMLQTTLVGQLYTVLDGYTKKFGFPNPAPPDAEIVIAWDNEFTSLRRELESGIAVVAQGKVVHQSMALPAEKDKTTVTGLGIRNKVMNRKASDQSSLATRPAIMPKPDDQPEDADALAPPKPPRQGGSPSPGIPSPSISSPGLRSVSMPSPGVNFASKPGLSPAPSYGLSGDAPYDYKPTAALPSYPNQGSDQAAGGFTPPSRYLTPVNGASPLPSAASNGALDYFGNRRPSQASSIASSAASAVAAKKKPPPPVPTKRMPSQPVQYVTALYDFDGQNAGDLSFKEGDRIRVVKKTESTDDWWDGELKGKVGTFPANYMRM